jgi:hypothetical protein
MCGWGLSYAALASAVVFAWGFCAVAHAGDATAEITADAAGRRTRGRIERPLRFGHSRHA